MWGVVVLLSILGCLILVLLPAVLLALCLIFRDLVVLFFKAICSPCRGRQAVAPSLADDLIPVPSTFFPARSVLETEEKQEQVGKTEDQSKQPQAAQSHSEGNGEIKVLVAETQPEPEPAVNATDGEASAKGADVVAIAVAEAVVTDALVPEQVHKEAAQEASGADQVAVSIQPEGESQDQQRNAGPETSGADAGAEAVAGSGAAGSKKVEEKEKPKEPAPLAGVAENNHLLGIPRRLALGGVNALSIIYCKLLNSMKVVNQERLLRLVHHRPPGTPLITISNHMSVVDDPFMWGQWSLRFSEPSLARWTLTAKDISFPNVFVGYLFRMAKCIPIDRRGGIDQPGMDEAVSRIRRGEWLHIFPEGGITQTRTPLKRLKWGLASLLHRAALPEPATGPDAAQGGSPRAQAVPKTPILLCIAHSGFETIMPEPKAFGKRAIAPLWGKKIRQVVGEPFSFNMEELRRMAQESVNSTSPEDPLSSFGLEPAGALGVTIAEGRADGSAGEASQQLPSLASAEDLQRVEKANEGQASAGGNAAQLTNTERSKEGNRQLDEVTKRLYTHITAEIRQQLDALVQVAHSVHDAK